MQENQGSMKILVYAGIVSPHMIPLCDCLYAHLGKGNFLYCATLPMRTERARLGWKEAEREWIVRYDGVPTQKILEEYAETYDALFVSEFESSAIDCFRRRGKTIIYASERWLKPPFGIARYLKPSFVRRALVFSDLLKNYGNFVYLPIGPHAAADAERIVSCSRMNPFGGLRSHEIGFEKRPMGALSALARKRNCLDKMRMWGYYVEASNKGVLPVQESNKTKTHEIRVLWVGRLLNWKRVDTIVRAVGEHANLRRMDDSLPTLTLDVYGAGPMERRLKKMSAKYGGAIKFYSSVPIDEVRRLMREHDVYVLSSNGYEGWGAVVSEALAEGMTVFGTYEAGSSATILPEENLFHAGDWRTLQKILASVSCKTGIGSRSDAYALRWTAESGAKALCDYLKDKGGFNG